MNVPDTRTDRHRVGLSSQEPASAHAGAAIGQPVRRVDGSLKVRGAAPYTADHLFDPAPYYGWIVESTVGRGRIVSIDTRRAEAVDGVVRVLTHENAPEQRAYGEPEKPGRFEFSHALLQGPEVRYHGHPVALVIAETLEVARGAALLVEVQYDEREGLFHVDGTEDESLLKEPDELDGEQEPDVCVGDFTAQMEAADVTVDEVYTTERLVSAAMEPHATVAHWDGSHLTVHTSIQIIGSAVSALANTLKIDEGMIRVRSPYVGGGFGSKLGIHSDAVLAALGAMVLKHPVKLVQTRRNLFSNGPHRGNSHQRLRLGATQKGKLLAVGHDSVMPMAKKYEFAEPVAAGARASYATEALHTTHRVVPVDMPPIDSMRAPGEAIGSLALEAAMDELAHALQMDPLELRLKNLAEREPQSGKPFASNDLRRCLERGAKAFGWSKRPSARTRDGRWWNGWGMAACTRFNLLMEASARIRLEADGTAVAELDMTDIGTGSYTILRQIAAEELGLAMSEVTVELADSRWPQTAGSGGSFGAASAGGALKNACAAFKESLAKIVSVHGDSPLRGASVQNARLEAGRLHLDDQSIALGEAVGLTGGSLQAEGSIAPGEDQEKLAQYSYGAHFVELGVDDASGEVRLRRALGAFSFGRVLNPVTARSQLIGGMTYGIGGALTEGLHVDPRYGAFMNRDFAEYHLAVQRDVPPLEVLMLGEPDEKCGALGSKGIGELGLCGIGGAISSAVFHATGVRVRDFPITPDKVLAGMGPLAG